MDSRNKHIFLPMTNLNKSTYNQACHHQKIKHCRHSRNKHIVLHMINMKKSTYNQTCHYQKIKHCCYSRNKHILLHMINMNKSTYDQTCHYQKIKTLSSQQKQTHSLTHEKYEEIYLQLGLSLFANKNTTIDSINTIILSIERCLLQLHGSQILTVLWLTCKSATCESFILFYMVFAVLILVLCTKVTLHTTFC